MGTFAGTLDESEYRSATVGRLSSIEKTLVPQSLNGYLALPSETHRNFLSTTVYRYAELGTVSLGPVK